MPHLSPITEPPLRGAPRGWGWWGAKSTYATHVTWWGRGDASRTG